LIFTNRPHRHKESAMHNVATTVATAAFRVLCKHVQDQSRKPKSPPSFRPQWVNTITSPHSIADVRSQVEARLSQRGFVLVNRDRGGAFYQRGNPGIARLPCDRDVRWDEVPIVLTAIFRRDRDKTIVGLCFGGWPTTRFADSIGPFFNKHADREIDGIVSFLNGVSESPASEPPSGDSRLDDDFTLLGLARGCSWEQLQTAYRAACRTYHPDRLVGVPADVVKLAQEHFVKVQAAYERLRERTPQPS